MLKHVLLVGIVDRTGDMCVPLDILVCTGLGSQDLCWGAIPGNRKAKADLWLTLLGTVPACRPVTGYLGLCMELIHDRKAEVAASCCFWLEQHQHADLRAAATTTDVTFSLTSMPTRQHKAALAGTTN